MRLPAWVTVTVTTCRGAVRPGNEDSVTALGWIAPAEQRFPVMLSSRAAGPLVTAVADGLGGHAAGEVASRIAVDMLAAAAPGLGTEDAVRAVIGRIHAELLDQAAARPRQAGMATTLAAVIVTADAVLVAHVGDSRVYYAEEGLLDQLTVDDAVRGTLAQCLGGLPSVPMFPHVQALPRDVTARYLICSDGLHGYVARDTIRDLAAAADPHAAAVALTDAAFAAGAPDNVSLCLVDVPGAGQQEQGEGGSRGE